MSKPTGHICPHCEQRELVIDLEGHYDVPCGSSALAVPEGYVVRCPGTVFGSCNSPDLTGRSRTPKQALAFAVASLEDWKPHLINAAASL